ncbi:MAG: porin [Steroidobacteraceae bacterium]|jgi:type II secretory pathway pseudopilin PulG
MLRVKLAKPILAVLAACAVIGAMSSRDFADAQDAQQLQDQMHVLQQQMQDLQKQIQSLSKKQAAPAEVGPPSSAKAKPEEKEPLLHEIIKGFFGTLDVSLDEVTKGMTGPAWGYSCSSPYTDSGCVRNATPKIGAAGGTGPVGQVGYQPELGTNKSVLGYHAAIPIGSSSTDFIFQIETQPSITAAPGLYTSYTQQSNVVKAAIGYGDNFVGLGAADPTNDWGKVKFGTTYAPYKKSTDRMNPFSGMLGDYASIMGNTGGDNRVEFGTRLNDSIWYESPHLLHGIFSFDALWAPGQNRTYNNVVQSAGSPDCNGGNSPGSGNLPLNCDDGSFGTAYSVDLKFEYGGFYSTVAWELHKDVNRNSDGIGSNSPYYGALFAASNNCTSPSPLLDCADYNAYVAEYGQAYINANGFTPEFATDVANESAFKVGTEYSFDFGLSIGTIYEYMRRSVPADLEWQNERTRDGWWFFATQDIGQADNVSIGYAHAGATPGDPAGQHNYDPVAGPDYAYMMTAAWKHRFDKHFYAYVDWADTLNHGNSHYDLGAGGRSLTTDCHDGTNNTVDDYSSAGPTTWGGDKCHPQGYSVGMNYKF